MVFWIVVGTIVVLGMWSAATATYFAFRDDVLTRLIARQAEMQYAYEDRIDPAAGAWRCHGCTRLRHPKALADQRHRDLCGAARS